MKRAVTLNSAGDVIRALRLERGWTLEEMSRLLKWSDRSRLSKYETNATALSLPVLEELAAVFGKRPEALVLQCLQHRYPHSRPATPKSQNLRGRSFANLRLWKGDQRVGWAPGPQNSPMQGVIPGASWQLSSPYRHALSRCCNTAFRACLAHLLPLVCPPPQRPRRARLRLIVARSRPVASVSRFPLPTAAL